MLIQDCIILCSFICLMLIVNLSRKDKRPIVYDSFDKGTAFREIGRYDSAYYHFNQARKYAEEKADLRINAEALLEMASLLYITNNFIESEKNALEAVKIAQASGFKDLEYVGLANLAMLSTDEKDYSTGIRYNKRALEILDNHYFPEEFLFRETTLNNLGVTFQSQGDDNQALKVFDIALSNPIVKQDRKLYAMLLDNQAYSNFKIGNRRSVGDSMNKALGLRRSIRDVPGEIINLIHLSEYNRIYGDFRNAFYLINRAYTSARKFKLPAERMLCLQELIKVDPPNQQEYIQEYIKISDSLKIVERRNHNKFARIAFETDEIIKQKEEAELTERIYAGSALAVIAVISLTFTTLYQRSKNKKLQLHKIRQEADAEIMKLLTVHQEEITQAREDEKKRIGRELHDGVMNRLAGARIQLEKLAESQDVETIRKCLTHIAQLHNIESDLRAVSHNLSRDNDAAHLHFSSMLATMVEQLAGDRENYIISTIKFNDWKSLSSTFKIGIYRILQEALGNCIKHSGADQIKLTITANDNELRVAVADNGKGFPLDVQSDGIGLKNIRIRVKELNGTLSLSSDAGGGTTLSMAFPLKDHREVSQSKS